MHWVLGLATVGFMVVLLIVFNSRVQRAPMGVASIGAIHDALRTQKFRIVSQQSGREYRLQGDTLLVVYREFVDASGHNRYVRWSLTEAGPHVQVNELNGMLIRVNIDGTERSREKMEVTVASRILDTLQTTRYLVDRLLDVPVTV